MKAVALTNCLFASAVIITGCGSDSDDEAEASSAAKGVERASEADAEADQPTAEQLATSCLSEHGLVMHSQLVERAQVAFAERKAKAEAAGAETGGDAFDGEFSAPLASTEEIESIFTFNPALPAVPHGWMQENFLRLQSPTVPLITCELQVTLHDPSGPIASPDDFEPGDKDWMSLISNQYGYGDSPQRGVSIHITAADRGPPVEFQNPGLAGWSNEWITIHGQQAVLSSVDYYIENTHLAWQENGVYIGLVCQLISRDECIALAESFS